ncbi:MAG TPA: cell division protein ZapE [Gammaproteobacteria bacterium]|nr:cell division protein ZapE [Gammaproteobacteria bacterium]
MDSADSASLPVTPLARYHAELARLGWSADPVQEAVAARLDALHGALLARRPPRRRLLARPARVTPVRGLYIWGDTGRGKTWLVDLFYKCLPFRDKIRRHFHRFMADVHGDLQRHRDHADPLALVADGLANRARIICFDEFFVSDIADAMILGRLFEKLFARGVTLVATSNVPPHELYRDGLQRARFLPAIGQLEQHTDVVHMDGAVDYRLRLLERAEIYHAPLDDAAEAGLQAFFAAAAPADTHNRGPLRVLGREIPVRCRADGVAWFEFACICSGPRSPADYIEIARSFHTVLVAGVPQFTPDLENEARRFIALVDEFYDRNVKLILSAAVPLDALYRGLHLRFEFRRAASRLEEMRSHTYLARPHLP